MPEIPPEILLLIATHLIPSSDPNFSASHALLTKTLNAFSQTCKAAHALINPVLWRDLRLNQNQLYALLSHSSRSNYSHVKSLTLTTLTQSFEIRDLPAMLHFSPTPDRPLFPHATSIRFDDYVDYAPPAYAALPLLLRAEKLVNQTRVYSWRLNSIPPLWPDSLKVIELYCHSWSVPFITPGLHHVLHLHQLACPFRLTDHKDDIDPSLPVNEAYQRVLEVTLQWLVFSIRGCANRERQEKTGLTTWELRLTRGGKKEIAWAEQRVGEMLLDTGLGEGRVRKDEDTGEITLLGPKIIVE